MTIKAHGGTPLTHLIIHKKCRNYAGFSMATAALEKRPLFNNVYLFNDIYSPWLACKQKAEEEIQVTSIALRQPSNHPDEHGYGVPAFNINEKGRMLTIMATAEFGLSPYLADRTVLTIVSPLLSPRAYA